MADFPSPSSAYGRWNLMDVRDAVMGGNWPTTPLGDEYFEYVSMLLPGNGTNGAQNNTFLDSSTNNFTITRNGNTTQGSFSPYGSNWSNYFDGSGDYLNSTYVSGLRLINNDFTIEGWFFLGATQANMGIVSSYENNNGWLVRLDTTLIRLLAADGSVILVDRTYSFSTGVWYHFAFTRQSNNIKCFVNGTQVGATATISGTATDSTTQGAQIGRTQTITNDFNGYISNIRLVNGTALYTSAFTPPTAPLTAVSGTALLTCQSNRFVDNSSNALTITTTGSPSVQRFSPFSPTATYSTSVIGGSGYFDGSGDYLSTSYNSALDFGAGDFTVECWAYWSTVVNAGFVGSVAAGGMDFAYSAGFLRIGRINTAWDSLFSWTPVAGTWYHIAFTRSSGTARAFVNGVQVDSSVSNTNAYAPTSGLYVGVSAVPDRYMNGYISNVRLNKGTAVYTSNFTPPTAPLTAISGTSLLLLTINGAIFNNAMMNNLETVGNAQISTAVSKFGGGSMAFDGTGDWLTVPYGPTQNFGTGAFTIEMWAYLNSLSASYYVPAGTWGSGTSDEWLIQIQNNGNIRFLTTAGSTFYSASITTATWYHIAVVRSGSTVTIYVNGTSVGSYTCTNSLGSTSKTLYIGTQAGTWDWNGYIDDFRITNGYARYTANFTPPTAAFPTF